MSQLVLFPRQRVLSNAIRAVPGALAYVFQSGTTSPLATYSDPDCTVAQSHPVEADAYGVFAPMYVPDSVTDYGLRINEGWIATGNPLDPYQAGPMRSYDDAVPTGQQTPYPITAEETALGFTVDESYPYDDLRRFGPAGDGVTPDDEAFANALSVNDTVLVPDPAVAYRFTSGVVLDSGKFLRGANKHTTKILAGAAIDVLTLADSAKIEHLYLEGDTLAARGLVIGGTAGNQVVEHCRIVNFSATPVAFTATTAGSRCSFNDVEAWRTDGTTGSGKYAFDMASGAQLTAVPRKFTHIETAGKCAFNFGGCNDVLVSDSFLADLAFTTDSRGVHLSGCRVSNQAALTVNGSGVTFTGCAIYPAVTVSGAGPVVIQGCYTNQGVTDSSTSGQALLTLPSAQYTVNWTGASANPDIGDGTLRGEFSRNGDVITCAIELVIGSTTTPGSGAWRFGIPKAPNNVSGAAQINLVAMTHSGGVPYIQYGHSVLVNGATYVEVQTGGTLTKIGDGTPWTWAATDTLRIHLSYFV